MNFLLPEIFWRLVLQGAMYCLLVGQWVIDAAFPPHRVCRVPDVGDNLA